jgi:hypothetical protein
MYFKRSDVIVTKLNIKTRAFILKPTTVTGSPLCVARSGGSNGFQLEISVFRKQRQPIKSMNIFIYKYSICPCNSLLMLHRSS